MGDFDHFDLRKPGGMKRELRIMGRYIRLNLMSSLEFKLGFISMFVNVVLNLAVWLVYWSIILDTSNDTFGSWGAPELVIWYFFTEFSIGIFGLSSGLYSIYHYVIEEGMEPVLAQPYHPTIQIIGKDVQVVFLVRSIFACFLLAAGIRTFDISVDLWSLLLGILVSLAGIVIFNGIYLIVQTLSFWLGDIEFLNDLLIDIEVNMLRLPQNIVPTSILFSLFVIIPVGLFSTIPTMLTFGYSLFASLSGLDKVVITLLLVFSSGIILRGALRFFDFGLSRYEGVGE